ncbi:MAG: hypothetical protein JKY65_30255, partial [Planctomycetes bacterium]|nr:hypothetical protein [Planctomycetota bacterium]
IVAALAEVGAPAPIEPAGSAFVLPALAQPIPLADFVSDSRNVGGAG